MKIPFQFFKQEAQRKRAGTKTLSSVKRNNILLKESLYFQKPNQIKLEIFFKI